MLKKTRNLILLSAALVVLCAVYFISGAVSRAGDESLSESSQPLSYDGMPALGNIDSSKLVKIDFPGFTIEKRDDLWELTYYDKGIPPGGIELDQGHVLGLTYSLAGVLVDMEIEDEPGNLSSYGLGETAVRTVLTGNDGGRVVYLRGDLNPSRTGYYVMQEGDPKIYVVSVYSAENMAPSLGDIRQRFIFPAFEYQKLTAFRLESPETEMVIGAKPDPVPSYLNTSYSYHFMTSPYRLARGVDGEALNELITPLSQLAIIDYIDDNPQSLAPYALDRPVRVYIESDEASLDLLLGGSIDGRRYAKFPGSPAVFTVEGLDPMFDAKPFRFVDKFALLVGIDTVSRLTVSGGETTLTADFQGTGDSGVYFLNGKKTETGSFRTFYQAVIGLVFDTEYPGPARNAEGAAGSEITIEYQLNTTPASKASITLVPYNRDFYALMQEGTMEFLIARGRVDRIFETAREVNYVE